ncbi:MAG: nicotinamide-nucleotide amidase [Sideroxyarcus sp.]|nr:nicotinamide-nucleotide amidase [Sideroxyarcus sp.]
MMNELAVKVGTALKAHGLMLATAESCTGGGVAHALTDISGSSAWFERGFVTYSNTAKVEMLGVRQSTLDAHGAVSEATIREMAAGALAHSRANISVSISGIAGPDGGTAEKPVGTVWFAWALRDGEVHARLHHLTGNRAAIREQSVQIALQGVLNLLNSNIKTA